MEKQFLQRLYDAHTCCGHIPSPKAVCKVLNGILQILFPELSEQRYQSIREFEKHYIDLRLDLFNILNEIQKDLPAPAQQIEEAFFESLDDIYELLLKDAEAIHSGDPAAVSKVEVIRTYPGFYAVAVYRLAHRFYDLGVPLIPRILTEHAHSETGIDIHPAAEIGEYFCIDHGTGVVIGETVNIGNSVKMYQGVTLGALSVRKDMASIKRHPTIEDRVVMYAGATILGGETVIGHDSVVGGSVWVTKSVPPNSRLYHKPLVWEQSLPSAEAGSSSDPSE